MISYFTRHPNAANLVMLATVVLGLLALPGLERETFPEFDASKVTVGVVYPNASATDVDERICQELDAELSGVTDMDELECLSVDGKATATATMAEGGDIGQFFNDISSIASSLNNLPDEAEQPTVSIAARTESILFLAVSGIDGADALLSYTDDLADRLAALSLVATAEVSGITESEYQILFDQRELRRYGVSPAEIADAVSARSLKRPLGTVGTSEREITLRYNDARRSIAELEDLVVLQNETGGFVRLRDLAEVRLAESEPEVRSFIDGRRAALIQLAKNKQDDALKAFDQVQAFLEAERARTPAGLHIDVTRDLTSVIKDRIETVAGNTVQGLVLVFAVMCLFYSLREAAWISLALPISFLGGVFVMSLVGITINMISLVALLMAVGLIMDDSIVIADNISKWRMKGVSHVEAARRGAKEVLPGVISSFLTTACVFGPLMFLSGEMGSVLKVVPMVLLITLAVSLAEAFLILPNHLSHGGGGKPMPERAVPRFVEAVKENHIIPLVRKLVAWRYLTLGCTVGVFIIAIGLVASGAVKVSGFPKSEGDTVEVRFSLSSGLPIERTESVVAHLLEVLDEINQERTPLTEGGQPLVKQVLVRYAANSDVKDNGAHTATITVDLLGSDARNVLADALLLDWKERAGPIPDIIQSNFAQTSRGPGGNDLDVQLSGRDLGQLERASSEMLARLLARDDVTVAFQDFVGGRVEARLKLNAYAYTIGLTPELVAGQLRTAFAGLETDSFRRGASSFAVRVELDDTVPSIADLEAFPVTLSGGRQVNLATVADVTLATTYPQITRKDGMVIAKITGEIDRGLTTPTAISQVATQEIGPEIERLYPGISTSIGGAAEDQQETQASIMSALLAGLIGVYLILAFQFRSYLLPPVIMLSIPFALIGTIAGHLVLGIDLAMPSFIGFASLAGIVVNNAILFLTFFEQGVKDGDAETAAVEAVRHRFQPVLLSSSTTFVGLMPILFETSAQAVTLIPLVTAVAFGLLASTVLVVFVFPAALAAFFDAADVDTWLAKRGELSRDHSSS